MRTFTVTGWLLVAVGLIAMLALGYCQITGPSRRTASKARDDATMAQTRTESAVYAIDAIGDLQDRGAITETQVEEAQNAIRQAPPADRDRVARAQLCRLQHRTDCNRLFGTGPADPDPSDPAR